MRAMRRVLLGLVALVLLVVVAIGALVGWIGLGIG